MANRPTTMALDCSRTPTRKKSGCKLLVQQFFSISPLLLENHSPQNWPKSSPKKSYVTNLQTSKFSSQPNFTPSSTKQLWKETQHRVETQVTTFGDMEILAVFDAAALPGRCATAPRKQSVPMWGFPKSWGYSQIIQVMVMTIPFWETIWTLDTTHFPIKMAITGGYPVVQTSSWKIDR